MRSGTGGPDQSALVGDGPELFESFTDHPRRVRYEGQPWIKVHDVYEALKELDQVPVRMDADGRPLEPPDPPPVHVTGEFPISEGWDRTSYLKMASLGKQYLSPSYYSHFRVFEDQLISDAAFSQLRALAPGCLRSQEEFRVGGSRDDTPLYHLYEIAPFTGGDVAAVVRSACEPVIPDDVDLVSHLAGLVDSGVRPVVAFSASMARSDSFMSFGGTSTMVVTEEFRDAWLATDLSRSLRESPREQDLWFVPSNGGFGHGVRYRWVDSAS